MVRTPGQAWRSRVTSSFRIAAACSAASFFARPEHVNDIETPGLLTSEAS
jgi:hypothetical protein